MKPKLLFIDDEPQYIQAYAPLLENEGFEVTSVTNQYDAERIIEHSSDFNIVITDLKIFKTGYSNQSDGEYGLDLIKTIKTKRPNLPIIVFSALLTIYAKDLGILGVSVLVSKSDPEAIEKLKLHARELTGNSAITIAEVNLPTNPEQVREKLAKELKREIRATEKILYIPEEGQYELIKHLVGFKEDIEQQITKFPYSKNVFMMMKFRSSNQRLSKFIIEILAEHGLQGIRADHEDWNITNDVFNPIAALYCCKYGIALFDEPEENQAYSANVAYELGIMHYQNKQNLILRHTSLPNMPFDFIKDLYVPYERELEVKDILLKWMKKISS